MLSEHPPLLGHPRQRQRKARANVGDAQLVGGKGTVIGNQDAGGKEKESKSSNELRHRRPKSGSRNHSLPSLAFGRSLKLREPGIVTLIRICVRSPNFYRT